MTIDWSKAPEGAEYVSADETAFYKVTEGDVMFFDRADGVWVKSNVHRNISNLTPRPSEPKPYTRDEALQFLVERLDSWPTDIADAPLCPGWGWVDGVAGGVTVRFANDKNKLLQVLEHQWKSALPFVPFVSVEDAQPATAKQPAPSGKGDPILGMVLADLTNRALEGREKYGEALKANNGRNALWDAYQEALDLAMYLRQAIEEQSK